MFFQLITLPVEFDASSRAKVVLQRVGIIRSGEEAAAVNSMLNAAGLTYVAAFIGSMPCSFFTGSCSPTGAVINLAGQMPESKPGR